MRVARSIALGLLSITLLLSPNARLAASGSGEEHLQQPASPRPAIASSRPVPSPTVALRAASGATLGFTTHNGRTKDDLRLRRVSLPQLVLLRNGTLTRADERTLVVEVARIQVPPEGVTVFLEVTTQHPDPNASSIEPITVWRESRQITRTLGAFPTVVTATFTHEFTRTVLSGTRTVSTPTDYFRYAVTISDVTTAHTADQLTLSDDYTFLMENQWLIQLPEVWEESEGAAPDELMVYYCDMFRFRKREGSASTLMPREDIPSYVRSELIPAMVEAFRVQTDDWGFPWHQAWTSYRSGKDAERLSVALTDGQTWYHGQAPTSGHSGISINVSSGADRSFDNATDAITDLFHHEIFHGLQQNIDLSYGGDGDVGGEEGAWQVFSEGTAVLASSVGQPSAHSSQTSGLGYYVSSANYFLSHTRSVMGGSPYDTAIFWRFLYEQCGGMRNGVEDPAIGMRIIRSALSALYAGDVVDITSSTDLVSGLPSIMDKALADTSSCPFRTYLDSLVHLARAIYALRLEGGRCSEPGLPTGCGFHDPNELYVDPSAEVVVYTGTDRLVPGAIRNSYGMAFVDVILDASAHGQPLVLEIEPAPAGSAEFSLQVWRLVDAESGGRQRPVPEQVGGPEVVGTVASGGRITSVVPAIDVTAYSRLGLIITRVDANERLDPVGDYTIRMSP